jgi:hypothetical protein
MLLALNGSLSIYSQRQRNRCTPPGCEDMGGRLYPALKRGANEHATLRVVLSKTLFCLEDLPGRLEPDLICREDLPGRFEADLICREDLPGRFEPDLILPGGSSGSL